MRGRIAGIVVLAISLASGTVTPARAQGVFYEVGLARGAFALWEHPKAQKFAFAFAGQGVFYNADVGGPLIGDVGCAGFGDDKRGVFGCGELSEFSIDDDLGTASGKGSFEATIFEFESGKTSPGGTVSFAATWKASGDPRPFAGGGFHFEPSFAGVFVESDVVGRDASDGVKGRVTSTKLGPGPTQLHDAATFIGDTVGLELHG